MHIHHSPGQYLPLVDLVAQGFVLAAQMAVLLLAGLQLLLEFLLQLARRRLEVGKLGFELPDLRLVELQGFVGGPGGVQGRHFSAAGVG